MEALFLQAASNDDFDWPLASFVSVMFICIAIVASLIIWQIGATWRARMSVAREDAYRALADESTRAQQRVADRLEAAVAELTDIRQRTTELERMLKEVG